MPRAGHPIEEGEITRIFDDARVNELACIGGLPADADRKRFAESVRKAAGIYAGEARTPTDNKLHDEIAALYSAAAHKRHEQIAALLEKLSSRGRHLLNKRAARPSLGLKLPAPEALRDAAQQKTARKTVLRLCQLGGRYVQGRRRPSGKRSITWRPLLHAPEPNRHSPKRAAERNFVMHLQLAWLEATGNAPSLAGNSARPGLFVRMVRKCLELVGAGHADAVGLINDLNRRRKKRRKMQCRSVRHQN